MSGSVLISFLVLCLFGGWMYFQQPSMIFYPVRNLSATPTDWGLQYEDVTLKSTDGIHLHGWYIPHTGTDRVLLFFHGNAGNMSHRWESVEIFHRLGLNVFIFDYRGYGQSDGKPSESGLYADARAAWQYLTKTKGIKKENITYMYSEVKGFCREIRLFHKDIQQRIRIEIIVKEADVNRVKDIILSNACCGLEEDGCLSIYNLEEFINFHEYNK